jgi:hypothetical protein
MSPTKILGIQSALVSLQIINAGIATIPHVPPVVPLIVAALVGGGQFFIQHVGNNTEPTKPQ